MLFFKRKQKADEFLPPPPPPAEEMEKKSEESLFLNESSNVLKTEDVEFPEYKKAKTIKNNDQRPKTIKRLQKGKKEVEGNKKANLKKTARKLKINVGKITKKKEIPVQKEMLKQTKRDVKSKSIKPKVLAKKTIEPDLESNFDFDLKEDLEDLGKIKDMSEFSQIDNLDVDQVAEQLEQSQAKSSVVSEAQDEIKDAIEKIKKIDRPSFFSRLFSKSAGFRESWDNEKLLMESRLIRALPNFEGSIEKAPEKRSAEVYMPGSSNVDKLTSIQNRINEARQALMKFDLEAAKKKYIDVMRIYIEIDPKEQAKVYQDIRDLYFERKNAEELKI